MNLATVTKIERPKALRGNLTAAFLFTSALRKVDSASIRAWAVGQRKVWLKIAASWLAKQPADCNADDAVTRFATFILCEAIGL